jgi:hypothetical protein
MFKSISRISTKKSNYAIVMKDIKIELPGIDKAQYAIILECRRGKLKITLTTEKNQHITPNDPEVTLKQKFITIS